LSTIAKSPFDNHKIWSSYYLVESWPSHDWIFVCCSCRCSRRPRSVLRRPELQWSAGRRFVPVEGGWRPTGSGPKWSRKLSVHQKMFEMNLIFNVRMWKSYHCPYKTVDKNFKGYWFLLKHWKLKCSGQHILSSLLLKSAIKIALPTLNHVLAACRPLWL
jgi:hypothetical protein